MTSLHYFHHWVEPLVYNYSSLIKASLHYLSQTSQNNLSKTSIWKTVISKKNESLNCLAFLESKKNFHPRKQTFLIFKLTEMKFVCDTICKSVRDFSYDVTDSWACSHILCFLF